MPTIPTSRDLGRVQINGRAQPIEINPAVANDIGRAGAAYKHAFDQIGAAFAGLGEKQQAMEDANWLADAKIQSLTADDQIRRDTELNAGADGTGFEQAPLRLDQSMKEIEAKPGGSAEARAKFKLWSAERHFETGRWAAATAQKRLQDSTGNTLDKRLDEMTNLSSANPDQANDYFKAYEDEVNSRVGSAITAQDGANRIEQARTNILKSATISKAIKNPADFGRAVQAIEGGQRAFGQENPETRANPSFVGKRLGARSPASVSFELETGKKDPLKGVGSINTNDSAGTHSYGNFGINSGGSAQQFAAKYGDKFGLTAKPGTAEFDAQWKNAARAAPVELHEAELDWWDKTIGSRVSKDLVRGGVSSDMAADPRVVAYFADRSVQHGPQSTVNNIGRVQEAFQAAKGDVPTFLSKMSEIDKTYHASDFRTASQEGYTKPINDARINGRLRLSLETGDSAEPAPRTEAARTRFDSSRIPAIAGSTIQPQELLSLSPKDYRAVVSEMRPYLIADTTSRMEKALSSLAAKGTQSIIKPEEIDSMTPFVGAKTAQAWKDQLSEGAQTYTVAQEVKAMTPEQRYQRLTELVPTGRVEDLSEEETKRFEIYSRAVQGVNSAIKKDPYGYFTIENESGRQAAKLLAGADPGPGGTPAREQAFDTLIRLQKQEGIAPGDIKILSPNQAQRITAQLNDAKTGPAAMQTINGLRQTYGKHFNQLWGEMVENGAPQSYLALRTATRKGQDALVESYALEKAMDEGGAKAGRKGMLLERAGLKPTELSAAVTAEISEFTAALQHKSGSARAIESYRSAAERVAAYYVATKGMSVTDAASQAANDLFKENLKIINGVPVPTEVYQRLGNQVERAMTEDAGVLIAPFEEFIIPPIKSSGGLYTPGHERLRYLDSIKANPQYVSKEDSTGVYLLDPAGDYVLTDTPDGPKPVSWTWEELAAAKQPYGYRQPFMFR